MGCGSSSDAGASAPGRFNDDDDFGADGARGRMNTKTGKMGAADGGRDEDGREDDFFEVEEAQGEQFMAVRPWIGQIEEPDSHNEVNNEQPDTTYKLEYVYGYRCADSRQNVYWNNSNQPVYMTAALGVILDPMSNTQQFFGGGEVDQTAKNVANDMNGHTDDIMCVSISPDRSTAVSGQVGSKPTIFTWDSATGEKKQRIKIAKGARGINAVAINADGQICAVDLHNEHQVYCFDSNGNLVFKEKGDTNKIHDICWDAKPGSTRFATAGKKHIYFWDASDASAKKKGLFGSNEQTSFSCVAACDQGKFYSGGANRGGAKIYIWGGDDGRTCEGTMDGHHDKGFICAMRFVEGNLFSGGKDGKVNMYNLSDKSCTKSWQFDSLVRAVDWKDGSLVVGTRDGTITGVMADDTRKEVMKSHSDGEVWGLAIQADGTVVTSGDDNKVMFWDPSTRCNTKTVKVSDRTNRVRRGASTLSDLPDAQCSRAVAVNADWIAVSSNDGPVSIRAAQDPSTEAHLLNDPKEWNEVMAFSPDNQYLAVGSHDNKIYVYSTSDWSLVGKCTGHSSYIMALDWCAHSKFIRSNCGAYELLFFTIPDCQQDPSGRSNTKAVEWATKTCKFQWETQGIYPSGTDGTHINSVCGSADRQLMATGDDYGLVNLFRDPVIKGKPRCYRGHSEHVVRVAFNSDDSKLFSIGGYDQTMMQWARQ